MKQAVDSPLTLKTPPVDIPPKKSNFTLIIFLAVFSLVLAGGLFTAGYKLGHFT